MSERAPSTQKLSVDLPASTILATTERTLGEVKDAGWVNNVSYVPNAAITGANSPASRTLTLVNRGQAGAGTTVIATLAYVSGVNGVANDEQNFTLSGTLADRAVAVGDILEVVSAPVGGTGLVDPGGLVQAEIGRQSS